ncbi:ion channel [Pseudonocardia nematodicida]|uniref:Ion channel n=1 Tax=Pseudonocardia nematodicida TaxID=1206997 RepID=A0ABV1KCA3_9PSEU
MSRGDPAAPARRLTYGAVLALVVGTYAVSLALDGTVGTAVAALLQVVTVRLSLMHSRARPRVLRFASAALGAVVVAVVVVLAQAALGNPPPDVVVTGLFTLNALLYLVAAQSILRDVLLAGRVDGGIVLAAIAAYLQIGMAFAFVYLAIASVTTAFTTPVDVDDVLFFSFVTLSTTGYGDVVVTGWVAETTAVLEIVVGQFFLVTAVGKIVAVWVPRRSGG